MSLCSSPHGDEQAPHASNQTESNSSKQVYTFMNDNIHQLAKRWIHIALFHVMIFLKGLSHTQRLLSSEPLEAVVVWTSCPGRCPSDPSPLSLASLQRWVKFLDTCHATRRNRTYTVPGQDVQVIQFYKFFVTSQSSSSNSVLRWSQVPGPRRPGPAFHSQNSPRSMAHVAQFQIRTRRPRQKRSCPHRVARTKRETWVRMVKWRRRKYHSKLQNLGMVDFTADSSAPIEINNDPKMIISLHSPSKGLKLCLPSGRRKYASIFTPASRKWEKDVLSRSMYPLLN